MHHIVTLTLRQCELPLPCFPWLAGFATLAFSFLVLQPAIAQSSVTPTRATSAPEQISEEGLRRQEARARDLQLQGQPNAQVLTPHSATPGPARLPLESPCFQIREVALESQRIERFDWLLATVAPYVNQCAGVQGLQRIAAALDTRLLETGYATTRVSLPPQNLADGKLTIQLHPGRVAGVSMQDAAHPEAPAHDQRGTWRNAFPLNAGEILNIRDLEQGVEQMNRLPSQSVRTRIEPGADADTSKIVIERDVAGERLRGGVALDNAGSASFGHAQLSAYLTLDHALGLNDILSLNLSTNLDNPDPEHRSQSLGASYSLPWGYNTVTLSASHSRFAQTVQATTTRFLSSGDSDSADVRLHRTIWRTSSLKTGIYLGAAMRSANSFLDDVELLVQRRRTSNVESGLTFQQLIGDASVGFELGLRRGISGLGAQEDLPTAADGGPTLRPHIWTLSGHVGVPWRIAGQIVRLDSQLNARVTNDRTLSIDQIGIGGAGSVRGFDGNAVLLAENGWTLRNELSMALAGSGAWKGIAYVALDMGRVWGPSDEVLVGKKLAGMAIGLRAKVNGLQFDAALGTPLYKPDGFQTRRFTPYVSVTYGF
jgi:hemolysin activation/secretion protein